MGWDVPLFPARGEGGHGEPMKQKVLIPLYGEEVAPRFDLATEVLIVSLSESGNRRETQTVVLPHASAEDLCQLVLTEKIDVVICGGIEEPYYQYLFWKKVNVLDSVIGPWAAVMARYGEGRLAPGDIVHEIQGGEQDVL